MKKIIYLSYDGMTDTLGQSQVIPYLSLLSKNYNITIISFEKTENLIIKEKISALLKKHNIDWVPLSYTKKPPVLSTVFDLIKLQINAKKIIKQKCIDLIHCRGHYITSIVGLKLKYKFGVKYLFDMRGFWADERIDGKIWNKKHFIFKYIYKYFKNKELQFLKEADHTISLTTNAKKEIESWNIINQSPISVIPCCTDEKLFQENNIKDLKNELNITENDFIISYVGSIGTWYMVDEMLDFFKLLINKKNTAKFLFITKDHPNLIIQKAKEKEIDEKNIIVQPSSREMMPSYIALSNFSMFFILPVFSKKASSPTKMGEIMNLGIPIICNSGVGDVDEIINECIPELLIKSFDENEYNRVIKIITNDYSFNTEKIKSTSHKYYSLEKGVEKYNAIYETILEN